MQIIALLRLVIPALTVVGFAYSMAEKKEREARRLAEDALRWGRTRKEFEGASKIAKKYGWHKLSRELSDKAKL